MIVNIQSNIPYLLNLNGEHHIEKATIISDFLHEKGVKWDEDALVVLNGKICDGTEHLKENDSIQLLIPIAGG